MERFGWEGTLKMIKSLHPDTFHCPRLFQSLSSLVLDTSGTGQPQLLWPEQQEALKKLIYILLMIRFAVDFPHRTAQTGRDPAVLGKIRI